jgi:hypothetical protein
MSTSDAPAPVEAIQEALARIRPEGFFGGARLLAADARVAYLLADEGRRRTMERLFGIPRDEPSGVATVVALMVLAQVVRSHTPQPKFRPTVNDVAFGFGALREAAYDVAGPWARESSYFGTLLAFALVAGTARAAMRKSSHGASGLSHQAYREFHHRYGHLIRRNRRRDIRA